MTSRIDEATISFNEGSALALTHQSHGSDMGLTAGMLGWEISDERMAMSVQAARDIGMTIRYAEANLSDPHPNACHLRLKNALSEHEILVISTGGGMIEVVEIDQAEVRMIGDCYETLIFFNGDQDTIRGFIERMVSAEEILLCRGRIHQFLEVKTIFPLDEALLEQLNSIDGIDQIIPIAPVLPILSRRDLNVPFLSIKEMIAYNQGKDLTLWELAIRYEGIRGHLTDEEVYIKMAEVIDVIRHSLDQGLKGTTYHDRILGYQSGQFASNLMAGVLLDAGMTNRIILYITALMEMKSAYGLIVAAPTAGACAALPGAVMGAAGAMGLPQDEMIKAMLAAGLIGVFIRAKTTFAAEVCGCQAECGSASGMAASALVTLAKGSLSQCIAATSMALQNTLGMICDPVANRVEVPCLGKNVLAATNALACANMAMAGYDQVIPLDEVIETMDPVGKSIPSELRCTARGGLSVSRTSLEIKKRLEGQN
jgi:L-serine dehydratase